VTSQNIIQLLLIILVVQQPLCLMSIFNLIYLHKRVKQTLFMKGMTTGEEIEHVFHDGLVAELTRFAAFDLDVPLLDLSQFLLDLVRGLTRLA
jgi:hypothetical protein